MPARATYITTTPLRRCPSPRRWGISLAILALLESGPKTASRLFRIFNPDMRRGWVLTSAGWKRRWLNVKVDYRVLMRHLRYLQRDGLIVCEPWLKILGRGLDDRGWLVKHYRLRREQEPAPPPPSPNGRPYLVSEIHNPLAGEEGMIRFIRWLRDPQPR